MRKLTNQEFLEKLKAVHGNEYIILEQYNGMNYKIQVYHTICETTYMTTPWNLLKGGCEKCGYEKTKIAQRKKPDDFINEVRDLVGDEYTFLSQYVNTTTKLLVRHNPCGNEYYVTPRDFLSGRRCPNEKKQRENINRTKSHEYFLSKVKPMTNIEYKILSKYENAKTKIKMQHIKCGYIFYSLPGHILEGKGCPLCWKEKNGERCRKTHEQFLNEISAIWNDNYELLSTYVKQTEKVKVLHKRCNRIFNVVPDSLLRGSGCPHCKESSGEKAISKWLIKNNINFIPQYKFDDCIYNGKLIFDFAIVEKKTPIKLIEYQGIQHYKPIDFFGGQAAYEIQVKKDMIKREFSHKANIPLIEIGYFDNINEALSKLIPR